MTWTRYLSHFMFQSYFRAGYAFEDNVSRRPTRGRDLALGDDPNKVT